MERIFLLSLLIVLFVASCEGKPLPPQGKPEPPPVSKVILEKEKMEREEVLPPEVKIKLKRDGKDNYSWEINGSDVNQILKVNEKLKKQLTGEQPR
jgi:hypothetical protein